jgi:competence ComEA-like helix-hairpin-helix protein
MTESTRGYALLLVCFLTVVILWTAAHPLARSEAIGQAVGYRIDVNTADVSTLSLLPGVGPSIAENIVTAREEGGRFDGPDDLLSVRFIGPKLLGRIESWVTYGGLAEGSDAGG